MIVPKLAKLLIWKIRQGLAVYQNENKRKRGTPPRDAKPMSPLMTMAHN